MTPSLLKEKITQAVSILKEKEIDCWLTFVRESGTIKDPALDLILGASVTWQSAFIITGSGYTEAIVGSLDSHSVSSTGLYQTVTGYVDSIKDRLLACLGTLNPAKIAINTSRDDIMSDGLTHGMYELLLSYLQDTPWRERLVPSQEIISALRGRKSAGERRLLQKAVDAAETIIDRLSAFLKTGLTEKEVAAFITGEIGKAGLVPAWDPASCPAVFTGPVSAGAHASPTDRVIEKGHIMNIDFGVKVDGYCSDLQRSWYFLRDGEENAPPEVERAFQVLIDAIDRAGHFIRPGVEGGQVDEVARAHIVKNGYPEFPHGLGHQVGRSTHDGAGLLCPVWERYGSLPFLKVEEGQVYTLEPRITLPGYGVVTVEEMIAVTAEGCSYLSHPQRELYLVRAQ